MLATGGGMHQLLVVVAIGLSVRAAPAPRLESETETITMSRGDVVSRRAYQYAASAAVCAYSRQRAAALDQIAKEQRYEAIGGAVNLRRRYLQQRYLQAVDDDADRIRQAMKRANIGSLPCATDVVATAAQCLQVDFVVNAEAIWVTNTCEPSGEVTKLAAKLVPGPR